MVDLLIVALIVTHLLVLVFQGRYLDAASLGWVTILLLRLLQRQKD